MHSSLKNCHQCSLFAKAILDVKYKYEQLVREIEEERNEWKLKYIKQKIKLNHLFARDIMVESDSPEPADLQVDSYDKYLVALTTKYPILSKISKLFLSNYHLKKLSSYSTPQEWVHVSSFYQSFLLDVFLRSRNSKAVMRTNLSIGLYLEQNGISEGGWRLLERLRVLPSRKYVLDYIDRQPPKPVPEHNVVLCSIDNCDIFQHMTQLQSEHRSTYLHFVNKVLYTFLLTPKITCQDI
jgi:hypothetical protein